MDKFQTYLMCLSGTDGELARQLWKELTKIYGILSIPNAVPRNGYLEKPTPADNGFWFGWDQGHHHLEIEILSARNYEWFYCNRATGKMDGYEGSSLESDLLKEYLSLICDH